MQYEHVASSDLLFTSRITVYTSPIMLVFRLLLILLLSDFIFFFALSCSELSCLEDTFFFFSPYEGYFFLILIFFQVSLSLFAFFKWLTDYYIIEGEILTHRQGILFPRYQEFILKEIETISFSRGFWGTIFHFGRVHLSFANQSYTLKRIPNVKTFTILLHQRKG